MLPLINLFLTFKLNNMKQTPIPISSFRYLSCSFLLPLLLLFFSASATNHRPPLSPDMIAKANTYPVSNINCDMLNNHVAGYDLATIAWDEFDSGTSTYTSYVYLDNGSSTTTITLPFGSSEPDVVIGNDVTASNNIVAVVYTLGGSVYLETYLVYVSGGALTYSFINSIPIAVGGYPHIDLFPDASMEFYDFVMVWHETGVNDIYGIQDNIRTITSAPIPTLIYAGGLYPDVAALLDISGSPLQTAEITFVGGATDLHVEEWIGTSISAVITPVVLSTPVLPRIEAMNTYSSFLGAKWMTVVEQQGSTYREVWAYSDVNTSGANFFTSIGQLRDCYRPVVAAGVGPATSTTGVGNIQYVGAACQLYGNDMFAMEFDLATTNPPSSGPYYSIINTDPMGSGSEPIATSSISNTGNGLLMAWWNGADIRYKYSNSMQFKEGSTSVKGQEQNISVAIYPNPATDKVTISGINTGQYQIADMSGKILLSGNVPQNQQITINTLPAGMYILNLSVNGKSNKLKLVKQ